MDYFKASINSAFFIVAAPFTPLALAISRNSATVIEDKSTDSVLVSFLASFFVGAALTVSSFKVPSKAALAVFTNSVNAFHSIEI